MKSIFTFFISVCIIFVINASPAKLYQGRKRIQRIKNKIKNKQKDPVARLESIQKHRQKTKKSLKKKKSSHDTTTPDARQKLIKDSLKHAWGGYDRMCFGEDEFRPVTNSCTNWIGAGLTLVDSLDILQLMGFKKEFKKASRWVEDNLEFNSDKEVIFFETVIRVVGGLLSTYDLTDDVIFLNKAKEVADLLDPVFNDNTGIPARKIAPSTGKVTDQVSACLSDIGTFQLEYFALSHHLGNNEYQKKAQHILDFLENKITLLPGLYPRWLDVTTGIFIDNIFSFGANADSFYEYLLKLWLLTGKSNKQYQRMYIHSMQSMIEHMLTKQNEIVFLPERGTTGHLFSSMHHLTCFVPGMLALGSSSGILPTKRMEKKHLQIAKDLCHTCYMMYKSTQSGLGAEETLFSRGHFNTKIYTYNLRPETVESIFYLWRITGDNKYREWGWNIFLAIEQNCRMENGYGGIYNVMKKKSNHIDRQESFFLSETLKYLWLLFQDPSVLPLAGIDDKNSKKSDTFYVFNTEAHPIKIWNTAKLNKYSN